MKSAPRTGKPIPCRVEKCDLDPRWVVVDRSFARNLHSTGSRTFTLALADGEEFTRDLPNTSEGALRYLDDRGLAVPGSPVTPGCILIGRIAPRTGPSSPEEKLLRAIFGEAAGDVRATSQLAPNQCFGEVLAADVDGDRATVTVGWERPLEVGDLVALGGRRATVIAIEDLERDVRWNGKATTTIAKVRCARDVIAARHIGPYDLVTQLPTEGRDAFGGQRVAPATLRRLARAAPWTAWELLTIKADCVAERARAFESLIQRTDFVAVRWEPPTPAPTRDPPQIFDFFTSAGAFRLPATLVMVEALLFGLGLDLDLRAAEVRARWLSDAEIRSASAGAVTRATAGPAERPEFGGLGCPRIFGPVEDYRCACGAYSRLRDRGVVCESCGVQVLPSNTRRERRGHVELSAPVTHPLDRTRSLAVLPLPPPDFRQALEARYLRVLARSAEHDLHGLQAAVDDLFVGGAASLAAAIDELSVQLVGKTVDFSGIAPAVCDAELDGRTCRLPWPLVLELFRPRAYGLLEERGYTVTIKGAKTMVEERRPEAMDALSAVARQAMVLLASDRGLVARRVVPWDEPAIALDPATARGLGSADIVAHAPLTHEASLELQAMPDLPNVESEPGGWVGRALGGESFVDAVRAAAASGAVDHVEDTWTHILLGRPPVSG